MMRSLLATVTAATALAAVAAPASAHRTPGSDAVSAWNANAGKAAIAACISPGDDPLHESRMYAMTHLAIHDALNAIDRRSRPYAFDATAKRGASPDAAVAAAARDVLVALVRQISAPFPPACVQAGVASVETDYTAALAAIPDGRAQGARHRGRPGRGRGHPCTKGCRRLGHAIGGRRLPAGDRSRGVPLHAGHARSRSRPDGATSPRSCSTTARSSGRARRTRLPSRKYAADLNEIKALGGDGVTTPSARTPEQTEIALFWVESSPLQWNRIARTVSARLDPWSQSRLFALLNMALADGYVSSFETKYHYDYWRPVTAIRAADTDGNPRTSADPTWTPLVTTPPIPDYDSAHAVQGGAGATVLKRFFGTDRIGFSTCSLTLPAGGTCTDPSPITRSYASFSAAAAENGISRILVGFHFRKAVDEGIEHGNRIGDLAVDRFLRPVR